MHSCHQNVPDTDPQRIQANELYERILLNFHSAIRETFTTLYYPLRSKLVSADFSMKFEENKYRGEEQVLQVLQDKMKFENNLETDIFRKQCERRLFTTQSLPWKEIKQRAATNTDWQWHHPDALDNLKAECIHKDLWREDGGYVDKGPFPQPQTDVLVKLQDRGDNTGEVILKVTPVHGDTVYYEIGGEATTASARVEGSSLKTRELTLSFLAVDSNAVHEKGEAKTWQNPITLKHRIYQSGHDKRMELCAVPQATIHNTTDGSDPKVAGAVYEDDFLVPPGTSLVLAYAEQAEVESAVECIPIHWEPEKSVAIDPKRPAFWERKQGFNSTRDSYQFLAQAQVVGLSIEIIGERGDKGWIHLDTYQEKQLDPAVIEECLEALWTLQTTGQVQISAEALHFASGQNLLDCVEEMKTTLQPDEVKQ